MDRKFNTIALAYTNETNAIIAWSSDIFGSPGKYPKTYTDNKKNRNMLVEKFGINNTKIMKLELVTIDNGRDFSSYKEVRKVIDAKLYKDIGGQEERTCPLCGRNNCFHTD